MHVRAMIDGMRIYHLAEPAWAYMQPHLKTIKVII